MNFNRASKQGLQKHLKFALYRLNFQPYLKYESLFNHQSTNFVANRFTNMRKLKDISFDSNQLRKVYSNLESLQMLLAQVRIL